MSARRIAYLAAAMFFVAISLRGDDKAAKPRPITSQTRMNLIRAFNAELVYARRAFPMGKEGVSIKDGVISPGEQEMQMLLANYGPAVKAGDQTRITAVQFGKNSITFEINGGPKKKTKWYQRIQVGGSGGMVPISPNDPNMNPRGSYARLEFDKYVPDLTVDQVKQLLKPVLNFDAKTAAEAFMDTVPPKVRDAIKNHRVLVGMDRDMVMYAKGRPPRKLREKDSNNTDYEEWIYGAPPQDVEFVRFVGDEVVRVETMKVDGTKIVQTQKEVELAKSKPADASGQPSAPAEGQAPAQAPAQGPTQRPTLRRPGEEVPAPTTPGSVSTTPPRVPGQPAPGTEPPVGVPPTSMPPGAPPPE